MANKVLCDTCNKDLSETDMRPKYRIHVHSESIPQPNGTFFILVSPPFNGELCFCDVTCLSKYFFKLSE